MATAAAHARVGNDAKQVRRGDQGRLAAGVGDGQGELACAAKLAVLAKPLLELLGRGLGQQLGRRRLLAGVHAHVERRRVSLCIGEAEAALRAVELRRRHAEVEQDGVDVSDPQAGHRLIETAKRFVNQVHRCGDLAQSLATGFERSRVAVESDQGAPDADGERNSLCVTTTPDGSVDDGRSGLQIQMCDGLIE